MGGRIGVCCGINGMVTKRLTIVWLGHFFKEVLLCKFLGKYLYLAVLQEYVLMFNKLNIFLNCLNLQHLHSPSLKRSVLAPFIEYLL